MTATTERGVLPVQGPSAVYPGTFDPFTLGRRDLAARARVMFDWVIVLLAVNADSNQPPRPRIRAAWLPTMLVRVAM
ncbi:adenylyltransferase/cytidyltransferase family protein [Micromonospora arborensis]|uniref:adenylyltransferase/cytidyltransferase family protein n=1 Tax=Micromonospora arborensis TaxID=2116518 RepID=UPI0033D5682B